MSREDAVSIVSRSLSVLFTVFALVEMSYLPEFVHSYLRYTGEGVTQTSYVEYMHHYHLLRAGFLIARIVGYLLFARWFYKGGPAIEDLLLPSHVDERPVQN